MSMEMYNKEQERLCTYIEAAIRDNKEFLIARFSDIESRFVHHYLTRSLTNMERFQITNNAGINVTSDESAKEYVRAVLYAFRDSTIHCTWNEGAMKHCMGESQDYIRRFSPDTPSINAISVDPAIFLNDGVSYNNLWLSKLRGKRILVISPFVETMKAQVNAGALPKIFNEPAYLAENTFVFVKAPLTLAGNHSGVDWRERFAELKAAVAAAGDFDVALAGCGGYGMPICHYIYKELRRSAIYVGGALQLFFGIYGERWRNSDSVKKYIESAGSVWVRPDERPANLHNVERGCYW